MRQSWILAALTAGCLALEPAVGQAPVSPPPSLESGSVIAAAERLKAGQYLWAPEVAPEGPVLLVVSLATQRAVIYRNGVPIGVSTVSTGRPGYRTPTGTFTVLQRHVEHYSSTYDNAPMPYMQRLTWRGVALHGGNLPGYPASHGCIRLPHKFARLLYGVTRLGMTVVITDKAVVPRVAPAEALLARPSTATASSSVARWYPEVSPSGPVSIVISASDKQLVVLRNGVIIGQAPATIDGSIERTTAYVLRSAPGAGQSWLQIGLPGQLPGVGTELKGRVHVSDDFRRKVESILRPGTTVVVTQDSIANGDAGRQMMVVEGDERL